jgi:hypothetical protein
MVSFQTSEFAKKNWTKERAAETNCHT